MGTMFNISDFRDETDASLITTIGIVCGSIKIDRVSEIAFVRGARLIPLASPGTVIDLGDASILLSHVLGTAQLANRP